MKEVCLVEHVGDKLDSDFRLMRLIEWGGFKLNDFSRQLLPHPNPLWQDSNLARRPKVLLTLGPSAVTEVGLSGSLGKTRGYVQAGPAGTYAIPSNTPAFIQRGQSKYAAVFINDLQKAVELACFGLPPQFTSYLLNPSPLEAYQWAKEYRSKLAIGAAKYLAFDIETPGKGDDEEEADTDPDAPDRTWNIERIGFAYSPLAAISFPWAPEYYAAIRLLLESDGDKVVWNAGFDVPRIRRAGVGIAGTIHDGMVAWHILHSDLPKRLGFVATFTCPWQPAWKHLSGSKPAFYNATDADVELRSMLRIEAELKKTGLWEVYQRDVVELEPILIHMHQKGMPVDAEIRLDRARKLAEELSRTRAEMEQAVPLEARRIEHIYKKEPKDVSGLEVRPGTRLVNRCSVCGAESPGKSHFKRYVKKANPCSDGEVVQSREECREYYRLAPFTPSRDQLIRYHQVKHRVLPTIFDKKTRSRKVSFGERQLKDLTGLYKDDTLYASILKFRQLDKIAGTYVGRPSE